MKIGMLNPKSEYPPAWPELYNNCKGYRTGQCETGAIARHEHTGGGQVEIPGPDLDCRAEGCSLQLRNAITTTLCSADLAARDKFTIFKNEPPCSKLQGIQCQSPLP